MNKLTIPNVSGENILVKITVEAAAITAFIMLANIYSEIFKMFLNIDFSYNLFKNLFIFFEYLLVIPLLNIL